MLLDGKWYYFEHWDALYDFTENNPEEIERAEIILDMEEMDKEL